MGISQSDVTFKGVTASTTSKTTTKGTSTMTARAGGGKEVASVGFAVDGVTYLVSLGIAYPLVGTTASSSAAVQAVYNKLTNALTTAVATGALATQLAVASKASGATEWKSVTVAGVTSTPYTITTFAPTSSPTQLPTAKPTLAPNKATKKKKDDENKDLGAIIGGVVGGFFGLVIVVGLVYFFFIRKNSSVGSGA